MKLKPLEPEQCLLYVRFFALSVSPFLGVVTLHGRYRRQTVGQGLRVRNAHKEGEEPGTSGDSTMLHKTRWWF